MKNRGIKESILLKNLSDIIYDISMRSIIVQKIQYTGVNEINIFVYSTIYTKNKTISFLNTKRKLINRRLSQSLKNIKNIPKIRFIFIDTIDYVDKVKSFFEK